jgi:hypothetical protein
LSVKTGAVKSAENPTSTAESTLREPQNVEQGMSNVEVWNRCALPFL